MTDAADHVFDLILGRWRSQTLYAGVDLGVFDVVRDYPKHAVEIADQLDIDRDRGYRLLRALGSLGLLDETPTRRFSITPAGELLREEHPSGLKSIALLEEGPTHYAVWKHLTEVVRDGGPDGFEREFDHSVFEHLEAEPDYAARFQSSMTSLSKLETAWTNAMLDGDDFADVSHVCDVAGGHGHLLCSLLDAHPHLEGIVLELPEVVDASENHVASRMGVDDRCRYVAGDMFQSVPQADVYLLKNVLHDWDDGRCEQILTNIRESAPTDGRLFAIERVVPGPEQPHYAKLFDIHMMVAASGRERTAEEYADLLETTGWEYVETRYPAHERMGAVEAVPG